MDTNKKDIINWNSLNNEDNMASYEDRSNPNYKRFANQDAVIQDTVTKNWESESNYHNSYRVNGKNNKGRTLKKNDR